VTSAPVNLCIVDYGMGNIGSVRNAFRFLGASVSIAGTPRDLSRATAYVLPGVGAFGEAVAALTRLGLIDALAENVLGRKRPLLGICLGMQLLFEESLEKGRHRGLGWIPGRSVRFPYRPDLLVPHVGWSSVEANSQDRLFQNIPAEACFYFDHSYYLECEVDTVTSICHHGHGFAASVQCGNIFATQFHPEKSQRSGLKMLRNFLNACSDGVPCR
jgi:imidazole glycerol-phosphate synthase subunit HisH